MMALSMPGAGFEDCSLLLPRMLGYFGTHYMVLIEALALVTFGFFRPEFSDLPGAMASVAGVSFVIFLIDEALRLTCLYPRANYFFAVETEGNFLLEIFHRWIPVPYLYLLPSLVILAEYMALVMAVFTLAAKGRRKTGPVKKDGTPIR